MLRFIPQQQWASTDDWEPHREIISSLYWDQDRPLKEVAEIMRRKHSFIATERMYKSRLKNWGLTKYLKAKEVEEVRREVANGKIGLPLIRGRIAGPKRLKQQVNRILPRELATATETAGHAGAISTAGSRSGGRNPSPLTGRMNAPNQFRYIEVCLKAVSDYSHSRIQANTWDPLGDYLSQESSDDWPNKVLLARATIQKGKMKDGFRLLDICLKNYRPLLCLEHPLLLIETYNAMLSLSEARYDLAESVIGYIVGLCRVVLGPSHPFTRLWTCLGASGMGMARQAAVVIVKSQLALLTTYFSPNAEFILIQQVDSARQLHEFGNLSMSDAERSIMDAIEKKQWKSDPDENVSLTCLLRHDQPLPD
ncbi:Clr5 domain-containing protein [Xylariales sp. AK1849]|nr:Clr5 domain-containing protein [Xylariales sp. AK1849]